jgi:hypothetical protein
MKCEFVTFDGMHFKCKNCGVQLRFTEYQHSAPVFVCKNNLKSTTELGFLQKIKNFAKATLTHLLLGSPMCDDNTIKLRYNICKQCEHFSNNSCKLCGCPLKQQRNYISKLAWADQKCPIEKW